MKKILALLIAMMLTFGMVAMAEEAAQTALILGMDNINANTTDSEGNPVELNMEDLAVSFVIDTEDTLRVVAQADKGEENLAFAVAELVGNTIHFSLNGMEHTYEYELPEGLPVDISSIAEGMRTALPQMMNFQLPQLPPISLPKIDLAGFATMFGAETGADGTTTFTVPAETVSQLINMLAEIVKASIETVPQAAQINSLLDQLVQSGLSFEINGTITDNGSEQVASIAVHMASNGETAADPTLYLNTESAENSLVLAVDVPSEDGSYTVAKLDLVTDPAADTVNLNIDFMGMITVALDLHKEDGLQVGSLVFDAMGEQSTMNMRYGEKDGTEYYSFESNMQGQSMLSETSGVMEDGVKSGTYHSAISSDDKNTDITADWYEYMTDYDMGGYELPADVLPVSEMDQEELQAALQPLMDYVQGLLGVTEPAA